MASTMKIEGFFIALLNFADSKIIEHSFMFKNVKTVFEHWPCCTWHLNIKSPQPQIKDHMGKVSGGINKI